MPTFQAISWIPVLLLAFQIIGSPERQPPGVENPR